MSIAPNRKALKKRMDRYLWDNNSEEMKLLQEALHNHFDRFARVAIIGGLVRDIAREGRSSYRTDVDLVIEDSSENVAKLAKSINAIPNRFGGYGFKDGLWKIDFWALETTWARRHIPVNTIEDLIKSTFFDWDAVAYVIHERKLICCEKYLEILSTSVLDINLHPNPSTMGNLVRAIRRIAIWNAKPGPALANFIDEHLNEDSLSYIQEKEKELYQMQVSTKWKSASEAKNFLFSVAPKKKLQLALHYQHSNPKSSHASLEPKKT